MRWLTFSEPVAITLPADCGEPCACWRYSLIRRTLSCGDSKSDRVNSRAVNSAEAMLMNEANSKTMPISKPKLLLSALIGGLLFFFSGLRCARDRGKANGRGDY